MLSDSELLNHFSSLDHGAKTAFMYSHPDYRERLRDLLADDEGLQLAERELAFDELSPEARADMVHLMTATEIAELKAGGSPRLGSLVDQARLAARGLEASDAARAADRARDAHERSHAARKTK